MKLENWCLLWQHSALIKNHICAFYIYLSVQVLLFSEDKKPRFWQWYTAFHPKPYTDLCIPKLLLCALQQSTPLASCQIQYYYILFKTVCVFLIPLPFFFFFPMYRVNHCIYLAPLEENIGNIGKQEISLPSASAEPGFFPLSFFFLVLCIFFIFLCSILEW